MNRETSFRCDYTSLTDEQKAAIETLISNCQEDFFHGINPSESCERFRLANRLMASCDPTMKERGQTYNRILLELYNQKP